MPQQKLKQTQHKDDIDYEKVGRLLFQLAEYSTASRRKLLWISFLRGLGVGFGTVLGATILISMLVYILSFFDQIPLIGEVIQQLRDY